MVFLKKVDLLFLMTMSQIKIPKTFSWEFSKHAFLFVIISRKHYERVRRANLHRHWLRQRALTTGIAHLQEKGSFV